MSQILNVRKYPKISIIIPLYIICDRFFSDLLHYKNLKYPDYEILIVSDKQVCVDSFGARIILTGCEHTGPAEKRDIASREAHGDILAFIDDDAYPRCDWLQNAIKYFDDPNVGSVGGPGITPIEDNFWQRAGGAVYESFWGSGSYQYRFVSKRMREVDDYPAYNLLIKRDLLLRIGGFNSQYYGGEDTKVCLEIIKNHEKIVYAPDVVVYHHRRSLFVQHIKQIKNVGIHRGYFVKAYPETSLRFSYFLPSLAFLLTIVIGITSLLFFRIAMLTAFAFSGLIIIISTSIYYKKKNASLSIITAFGLILHHLAYGYGFLKGLFIKKLER